MNRKEQIAEILLDLKAVSVSPRQPFTWASGLRAPLYCDNRLIISTVAQRRIVIEGFVALMQELDWKPEVVAGTATAGIPHAAWLAEALSLPMIYIRSAEKKHGKKNRIEGTLPTGAEVVVIEDLISTGGSSISAAQGVEEAGGRVLGIAAIFRYGMSRADKAFAEADINYASLTDLPALLDVALRRGYLVEDERQAVLAWREDPALWSQQFEGKG